tara:strand:- start:2639 stop:3373 length:735 start_codon:yes stop_codon:yes gene_type:complete
VHLFYREDFNLIEQLKQLQDIDTKLQDINELLGDLPEKVEELDEQESRLIKSIDENLNRSKTLELELSKIDVRNSEINNKIEKSKDQLFLVTNNKQYDAIMNEIDHLKEENKQIENQTLEMMEEKESLDSQTSEMQTQLENLTSDLVVRRKKLNNAISESADEKSILDKKRTNHVNEVDEKTFLEYEKVLNARDGLAVVSLSGYSCGGCGAQIPMQTVVEIRSGTIHRCGVCGRFLYNESKKTN